MSLLPVVATETILVVDDTPTVLDSISAMLKKDGFNVLSASSPEQAIQISLDCPGTIDLLLTDVMMPKMSGPDLATKLVEQRAKLRAGCIKCQSKVSANDHSFLPWPKGCIECSHERISFCKPEGLFRYCGLRSNVLL